VFSNRAEAKAVLALMSWEETPQANHEILFEANFKFLDDPGTPQHWYSFERF